RDMGAKTVVMTCGGRGALLASDQLTLRSGVYPIHYVDGTGSGDAFDAGFLQAMLLGADPVECLRWGSAMGASCVRAVGATAGVFTRAEAEAFMRTHDLAIDAIS
ncbi:MAG TPA: carbohydrate kinase family protein, partial [Pirellulales bacterium]